MRRLLAFAAALGLALAWASPPAGLVAAVSTDPAVVGQWSAPISWPNVAVHGVLLDNGKLLTYDHGASTPYVYDPASGSLTNIPNPFVNPVCGGANVMADGRIMTVGGGGITGPGIVGVTAFDST